MNAFLGQQKLRSYTDYDNSSYLSPPNDGNIYNWGFSMEYVEKVVGKIRFMSKFFGKGTKIINKMLI